MKYYNYLIAIANVALAIISITAIFGTITLIYLAIAKPQVNCGITPVLWGSLMNWIVSPVLAANTNRTLIKHSKSVVGNVWPIPYKYTTGTKTLILATNFYFDCHAPNDESLQLLTSACTRYQKYISEPDGLPLEPRTHEAPAGKISVATVNVLQYSTQLDDKTDESYSISVSDTGTTAIKANSVYGAMRALETFTQLVHRLDKQSNNERYLPGVPLTIDDQPEYAHRGLLLDTARSYYPVGDILRQLDGMAMTKLNVFHWHIADSQSFPVMSEVLPRLAQYGAYGPNMIYTKQDIQSVVQYARERGIRVIPEYDTPGHTYAWGLAYPNLIVCSNQQPKWNDVAAEPPSGQLDPTNPESLNLVAKLIKEQATWFTDPYFHVGGDEVNQKCYTQEPHIAKYLEQHKMSVSQLIGEFAQGLHAAVRENHKIPITWEEALREYKVKMGNDTIVQVWKSPSHIKDVLQQGLRVIVSISSHWYLDRGQGDWMWSIDDKDPECDPYRSWQHMYAHNIIQGLEATGNVDRSHPNVLGGEVALWSEKSDAYVLDMRVWPRAGAVAEKLWSGNKDADGQIYNSKDALPRIYKLRHRLLQQGFRADPISMPWCELHPGSCDRYKFE